MSMQASPKLPDWVERMQSELDDCQEELSRLDDQGRVDFNLQKKAHNLRSSIEAAKKIYQDTDVERAE
jgi:hypothetical protein